MGRPGSSARPRSALIPPAWPSSRPQGSHKRPRRRRTSSAWSSDSGRRSPTSRAASWGSRSPSKSPSGSGGDGVRARKLPYPRRERGALATPRCPTRGKRDRGRARRALEGAGRREAPGRGEDQRPGGSPARSPGREPAERPRTGGGAREPRAAIRPPSAGSGTELRCSTPAITPGPSLPYPRPSGLPRVHAGLHGEAPGKPILTFAWGDIAWRRYVSDPTEGVEEPRVYLTGTGDDPARSRVPANTPNARMDAQGRLMLGIQAR